MRNGASQVHCRLDERPASSTEGPSPRRIGQEIEHGPGERLGLFGQPQIAVRHGLDPLVGLGRGDHRLAHGERLEQLVLQAGGSADRHHADRGPGDPVGRLVDRAGDLDAVLAVMGEQGRGRIAADEEEPCCRAAPPG